MGAELSSPDTIWLVHFCVVLSYRRTVSRIVSYVASSLHCSDTWVLMLAGRARTKIAALSSGSTSLWEDCSYFRQSSSSLRICSCTFCTDIDGNCEIAPNNASERDFEEGARVETKRRQVSHPFPSGTDRSSCCGLSRRREASREYICRECSTASSIIVSWSQMSFGFASISSSKVHAEGLTTRRYCLKLQAQSGNCTNSSSLFFGLNCSGLLISLAHIPVSFTFRRASRSSVSCIWRVCSALCVTTRASMSITASYCTLEGDPGDWAPCAGLNGFGA